MLRLVPHLLPRISSLRKTWHYYLYSMVKKFKTAALIIYAAAGLNTASETELRQMVIVCSSEAKIRVFGGP